MSKKGYIKLYRDLQDCWIWQGEKFTKGQAWVDLLLMANHKDTKIPFGDHLEIVKRGQFITSIKKLGKKWGWSFNTVKRFLNLLESDNMLTRKSDNSKTLVTIVNYEIYQSNEDDVDEQVDRPIDTPIDRPIDEHVADLLIPNNNEKNNTLPNGNVYIAHRSANYSAHFEEFWKCYKKKRDKTRAYACYNARLKDGFSEDELLAACKNYMSECEKEHREDRYIKDAKTFLSVNTPFVDYIPKDLDKHPGIDTEKIFDLAEQTNRPYFGFPKEWFDGETLVKERVTDVVQPKDTSRGLYEDREVSASELIELFEIRRRYAYGES